MSLELEILTLVVGAIAMLIVLSRAPRRRRRAREQPPQAVRPADLVRVEHELAARQAAAGVHGRLRPLLAEIAVVRLERRRQLSAAEARELLGDELWELVRPNRPGPSDPHGPGLSVDQLARMVDRLEQL